MISRPGSYQSGFAPRDFSPQYPQLWSGCLAAWAPCLGPTGTTLLDWSGRGQHSTLTNFDVSTAWDQYLGRYAIKFDGSDDRCGYTGSIVPAGAATKSMSCWFMSATTISTRQWLIFAGTDSYRGRFCFEIESSNFSFNFYDDKMYSANPLVTNTIYHACVTYDGATARLYLNGKLENTGSVSLNTGTTVTTYFGMYAGVSIFLNGRMDDIRIYDRVLTSQEVGLLASRRGIAYEPRVRERRYVAASGLLFPIQYGRGLANV